MRARPFWSDRRNKIRFPIQRELRYKLLEENKIVASGQGVTRDIGSGGIALVLDQQVTPGAFIEVSMGWPALLDASCPMRLNVFGRVLRSSGSRTACTIDKYEFRTQARTLELVAPVRKDSMLVKWADGFRKEELRVRAAVAAAGAGSMQANG